MIANRVRHHKGAPLTNGEAAASGFDIDRTCGGAMPMLPATSGERARTVD